MSLIGTVSSPMDARYSPRDTPDPAAPSVSETGPFMGNFTDAQQRASPGTAGPFSPGIMTPADR